MYKRVSFGHCNDEKIENLRQSVLSKKGRSDLDELTDYLAYEEDNNEEQNFFGPNNPSLFAEPDYPYKIEPFSIKNELKQLFSDPQGNICPKLDVDPDDIPISDSSDNEEEGLPEIDTDLARESLINLIRMIPPDSEKTVDDILLEFGDNQNVLSIITESATQLIFMGIDKIYTMGYYDLLQKLNSLN